jgi:hypothetical protein
MRQSVDSRGDFGPGTMIPQPGHSILENFRLPDLDHVGSYPMGYKLARRISH